MAKALSIDLRERLLAAVDAGLSCRQAAQRFGVSVSSAIRWCARRRERGDARPRPQGGDRRSHRIEAQSATILALVKAKPDMTLPELQRELAAKGTSFGIGTLWRFFDRHGITLKKSPGTRPSRIVPMCSVGGRPGSTVRSTSIPRA